MLTVLILLRKVSNISVTFDIGSMKYALPGGHDSYHSEKSNFARIGCAVPEEIDTIGS
jgi:hypothetical protein